MIFSKGLRIPLAKNSSRNNLAVKDNFTAKAKSSRGKEAKYQTFDGGINSGKEKTKDGNKELVNKYEEMLKKVNEEFQGSLEKNAELAKIIAELELKLYRTQKELEKTKNLEEKKQELEKEQDEKSKAEIHELKNKNQELSKSIKEKDDEIIRLRNLQIKLENKILNSSEAPVQSLNDDSVMKSRVASLSSK